MPIFECEKCKCVENTALSGYWMRYTRDKEDRPALCSECDPKIGKWHGAFEKVLASDCGYWIGEDGFLYAKEPPPHHTKLIRAI